MKNIILIWLGMITFMFFGLAFVKVQINPFDWNENTRMVFFLFSIFCFIKIYGYIKLIILIKQGV